jgi:hypothetical protein
VYQPGRGNEPMMVVGSTMPDVAVYIDLLLGTDAT